MRGNVTLPPDLPGNPEAIFEVVQLPTGEIIEAQLRKSSGVRAYDEAVQRAILKSSPLPRPERADLFQRTLTLKFRPVDQQAVEKLLRGRSALLLRRSKSSRTSVYAPVSRPFAPRISTSSRRFSTAC